MVLELLVPCAEDDPVGEGVGRAPVPDPDAEPPRTLHVTATLDSGRTASTELDLVRARLADGADLDPLLRGGLPDLSIPDLSTPDRTATCRSRSFVRVRHRGHVPVSSSSTAAG